MCSRRRSSAASACGSKIDGSACRVEEEECCCSLACAVSKLWATLHPLAMLTSKLLAAALRDSPPETTALSAYEGHRKAPSPPPPPAAELNRFDNPLRFIPNSDTALEWQCRRQKISGRFLIYPRFGQFCQDLIRLFFLLQCSIEKLSSLAHAKLGSPGL